MTEPKPASSASSPRPGTCSVALKQAAIDNTQLYFALLPSAIRGIIDRYVRMNSWRVTGMLEPYDLPPQKMMEGVVGRVLSAAGEEVLLRVVQEGKNTMCETVRPELPAGDKERTRRVSGREGNYIENGTDDILLLVSNGDRADHTLYTLWGTQLKQWRAAGTHDPNNYWANGIEEERISHWLRIRNQFFLLPHCERSYTVPKEVPVDHIFSWGIAGDAGSEKLALDISDGRMQLWDLSSGTLLCTRTASYKTSTWEFFSKHRVALLRDRGTTQIYSMITGAMLLSTQYYCVSMAEFSTRPNIWFSRSDDKALLYWREEDPGSIHEILVPSGFVRRQKHAQSQCTIYRHGRELKFYDLQTSHFTTYTLDEGWEAIKWAAHSEVFFAVLQSDNSLPGETKVLLLHPDIDSETRSPIPPRVIYEAPSANLGLFLVTPANSSAPGPIVIDGAGRVLAIQKPPLE